ncbi:MAG: class I SAM-dependent methyltransferase, partial [Bifidobacteriaceae bacterium]|nr:class I SAM-dependent methyltransferase [Bifidobacteriaceae bacterium]
MDSAVGADRADQADALAAGGPGGSPALWDSPGPGNDTPRTRAHAGHSDQLERADQRLTFAATTTVLAPSTPKARAQANLAAIGTLHDLEATGRAPSAGDQAVLARWSAWGAVPQMFESGRPEWDALRARLTDELTAQEHDRASATTLNAHYTDPGIAQAIWAAAAGAGVTSGLVLEPGCGSGAFIAHAPPGVHMVGVELDPVTARIASHLYPRAHIRAEGFERTRLPDQRPFVATVGNVPFSSVAPYDPVDNPQRLSLHNYFIVKAMRHVEPGGYGLLLTSSWTLDAGRSIARAQIARQADLVAAFRFPTGAFRRVAGTDVVADLLV